MPAFASLMGVLRTQSNKVCPLFSLFSPSFQLRPQHCSQEHMEKAALWAVGRANDPIYKGAFKQQGKLDWPYSEFSLSLSGCILPSLIRIEIDKIKDKSLEVQTRQETLDFGRKLVWDGSCGDQQEEEQRSGKGRYLSFLSIPRAPSPHHPEFSEAPCRGGHTTALSGVPFTKTTHSKVRMTNSANLQEAWIIPKTVAANAPCTDVWENFAFRGCSSTEFTASYPHPHLSLLPKPHHHAPHPHIPYSPNPTTTLPIHSYPTSQTPPPPSIESLHSGRNEISVIKGTSLYLLLQIAPNANEASRIKKGVPSAEIQKYRWHVIS